MDLGVSQRRQLRVASGMRHYVIQHKFIDVSEKRNASIFRFEELAK
jgi:hypothetical protein